MAAPTNAAKREESSCQLGAVHTCDPAPDIGLTRLQCSSCWFCLYWSGAGETARTMVANIRLGTKSPGLMPGL